MPKHAAPHSSVAVGCSAISNNPKLFKGFEIIPDTVLSEPLHDWEWSMIGTKDLERWLAEPPVFVAAIICAAILLCVVVLFGHWMLRPPTMDANALNEARSGVIVLNSDDPAKCKQVQFSNEPGASGQASTTNCKLSPPQEQMMQSGGALDSIRDALHHR